MSKDDLYRIGFIYENVNTRLHFHITDPKNLRSIMKEGLVPKKHSSNWSAEYESFGGIYISSDLKKLLYKWFDWFDIDPDEGYNIGLVVIDSKHYTQHFNDEDTIIQTFSNLDLKKRRDILFGYVNKDSIILKEIRKLEVEILKDFKFKFFMNHRQAKLMVNIIHDNILPIILRRVENDKSIPPEYFEIFGGYTTTELFNLAVDKLTKLKLEISPDYISNELTSSRISKTITYSGNPKIVAICDITNSNIDVLYSKLDHGILKNISDIIHTI